MEGKGKRVHFFVRLRTRTQTLRTAPVLCVLTSMVWVVVVVVVGVAVPWEAGMGLAGPRALKSSSLVSSKDPIDEGSARCRSSRGDPLAPESGEPGSGPS